MLAICVPDILKESLQCGFRPCHSVFIGGGHIFRPDFSFHIQILAGSSWAVVSAGRPPTGLMRTHHSPGGYQPHAKDLLFYLVSYTKVGLFISFMER